MIPFYVYVLLSLKDGKFYIGRTNNLIRRLIRHERGLVISTKPRRPFKLIFFEGYPNLYDAIRREKYFKTYHGKMFLKRRLKSYLTG